MIRRLFAAATSTSPAALRGSGLLVLAGAIAAGLMLQDTGPSHVAVMANDLPILPDGAWRITNGQVPHNDFYCPIGSLPLYLVAWGIGETPSFRAVTQANAAAFAFILLAAFATCRRRLPGLLLVLVCLHLGLLVIATRPLSWRFTSTSYAMLYNRYGEAVTALLTLILFLPPIPPHDKASGTGVNRFESFFIGILVGLTWFIKLNYFAVALGSAALALLLFRRPAREVLLIAAGLLLTVSGFMLATRIEPHSLLADLAMLMRSQDAGSRLVRVLAIAWHNSPYLALPYATFTLAVFSRSSPQHLLPILMSTGAIQLAALVLCATNEQYQDLVLAGIAAIIFLENWRRHGINRVAAGGGGGGKSRARLERSFLVGCVLCCAVTGYIALRDVLSVTYSWWWARTEKLAIPATARFSTPSLRDVIVLNDPSYTDSFNDGVALLRSHRGNGKSVVAFEFANPFSFALNLPPPRGDALWWHLGKTFDADAHPPAERVLGGAELVLVPKRPREPRTVGQLLSLYGERLLSGYQVAGESEYWTIFVRKP